MEERGYKDEERRIFRFQCGKQERLIDPLPPYWAMLDDPDFEADLEVATVEIDDPLVQKESRAAALHLIEWARKHLALPSVEEAGNDGVTGWEALGILYDFLDFLGVIKKKQPEPAPELPSSEQGSSGDDSPTKSTSD